VHIAAVVLTTFALVFIAELPDKTAIASLILGTRYPPLWVLTGVATAFACHVVLAVTAGSLLGLLPHRALQGIVAGLFVAGALLLLRGRPDEEEASDTSSSPGFWHVAGTSFMVMRVLPITWLTRAAALIMLALAGFSLASAISA
jgi:putative Ca2+/H+ antiporter (TMEM165/GDT1 family)